MGVHDCDCHQLPDSPSLVPNPRLTERRNSLLLVPRASHPRPCHPRPRPWQRVGQGSPVCMGVEGGCQFASKVQNRPRY